MCRDVNTVTEDFTAFITRLHRRSTEPPPGRVPESIIWLIRRYEYSRVSVAHGSATNDGIIGNTENVDRDGTSVLLRRYRVDV
jgi:hypothetical protein